MIVRLLPLEVRDGPGNMAADEVMLEAAVAGEASLRFYTWQPATLSLGYFQPHLVWESDPPLRPLPFVRRPSGGATLVHDSELTYALALPAGNDWQPRGKSWICRMHDIIAEVLRSFAVDANAVACGQEKKLGHVLCFQHQTPGDLILHGHKIAGSAQRKQRGALLQHGAILLARSQHAPVLPGIHELSDIEIAPERLTHQLELAFQQQTGWVLQPQAWTAAELARIRELAQIKYSQEHWTRKR
ncbi:MAG TPA: biotin/lipoate A/B protein ligase family protein [Gemmataceae bacterium]|nr:biotin/lipoate A/B protein ligase family protein [Gemmataceae bacterium]